MDKNPEQQPTVEVTAGKQELNLWINPDLYRAFQRCTWILLNETGRSRHEIMDEVVRDFLIKHGC